jgi:hypothetical protein
MVLGIAESLAINRYGMAAKMAPTERKMMDNGLTIGLAQLPVETTQRISDLSAPVMACIGAMFYVQRLARLEAQRRANADETLRSSAVAEAEHITNAHQGTNGTGAEPSVLPSKDDLLDRFGA